MGEERRSWPLRRPESFDFAHALPFVGVRAGVCLLATRHPSRRLPATSHRESVARTSPRSGWAPFVRSITHADLALPVSPIFPPLWGTPAWSWQANGTPTILKHCIPEITLGRPPAPRAMSSSRERVFDSCELLANIGGDPDLLHELVRLFLDRHRPLIQDIETAVHRGDSGALQQAAHTLKGMAANLCASTLVEVARELEAVGRRGHLR